MQIASVLPPEIIGTGATAILAGIIASRLPRVRGTTLAAPFWWALASSGALGALAAARQMGTLEEIGPAGRSIATYLAACSTFCPLMAVLGAKRPQDRAWQWIVASLWLILAVPALQSLVASTGAPLVLTGPWRWFVVVLLAVGAAVYFPTRFGWAALLAACGQVVLLSPVLLSAAAGQLAATTTIGCCLLALAAGQAVRVSRVDPGESGRRSAPPGLRDAQRRWLRFRDAWGALWALRVLLRVNQTAELQQWPVRFELGGIQEVDVSPTRSPTACAAQIDAALDAVLRRFERVDQIPAAEAEPSLALAGETQRE